MPGGHIQLEIKTDSSLFRPPRPHRLFPCTSSRHPPHHLPTTKAVLFVYGQANIHLGPFPWNTFPTLVWLVNPRIIRLNLISWRSFFPPTWYLLSHCLSDHTILVLNIALNTFWNVSWFFISFVSSPETFSSVRVGTPLSSSALKPQHLKNGWHY